MPHKTDFILSKATSLFSLLVFEKNITKSPNKVKTPAISSIILFLTDVKNFVRMLEE